MRERLCEFMEERFCPCISMRLEYAPQLFVRIVVCSAECSFDLSRMVSIVIDNRYAADLAFFLGGLLWLQKIRS